jgi:hypothetical protein
MPWLMGRTVAFSTRAGYHCRSLSPPRGMTLRTPSGRCRHPPWHFSSGDTTTWGHCSHITCFPRSWLTHEELHHRRTVSSVRITRVLYTEILPYCRMGYEERGTSRWTYSTRIRATTSPGTIRYPSQHPLISSPLDRIHRGHIIGASILDMRRDVDSTNAQQAMR